MRSRRIALPILFTSVLLLSACNLYAAVPPQSLPTSIIIQPSPTQAVPTVPITVPFLTPAPTDTQAPPTTLPTSVNTPTSSPAAANYIDDRSTPSQVIASYYNAIDRQEYLRAYSYYTNPLSTLGGFDAFQNGYTDTVSVDLFFGQITGDTSMNQTYFTVPVILKAVTKNAAHTNYAACYIVHQANPSVFGGPNFQPMSIDRGKAKTLGAGAQDAAVLATACSGEPTGPNLVTVGAESLHISKNNFIDNRSGPIETVSSLLNSINLKQYSRAYYYFDSPDTFPGPYNSFAAGYSNTDSITALFGTATSEGAAGNIYYKVPTAMKVLTTTNTNQAFVGCYTLRLSQPANQGVPPFRPLSIVSGKFTQVDNNADVNSMLSSACQ